MPIPADFLSNFRKVQSGELSYMVYSYDKTIYLTCTDKATDFDEDEFVECFNTSRASHAVLGVKLNDLRKTILIHWLGDSAPPQLKGRYAGLISEVESLISCHVVHNARRESDIGYKHLESLVMKASGAKYNLANDSHVDMKSPPKPSIPQRQMPSIPQITPSIPSRPQIPQRLSRPPSIAHKPMSPSSPNTPNIPKKSTTAQMISSQKQDEYSRDRSPSPPKKQQKDIYSEITELRQITATAAANWQQEPKQLSESDLRKLELEQLRLNPSTTAIDFEQEQEKKLSDSDLRKKELEAITTTGALRNKFEQTSTSQSLSSGLNHIKSKFENRSDENLSSSRPALKEQIKLPKEEVRPPMPTRESSIEPPKVYQEIRPPMPTREPTREPTITNTTDCLALYDYNAQEGNEISFKQGDVISNVTKPDADWWEGTCNNKRGLFPGNFVQESTQNDSKPAATSTIIGIAIYDYTAQESNELSFVTGDKITITNKIDEGWFMGECKSKTGLFPSAYST